MQLVAQIRRVRRLVAAAKALEVVAHDYDNDPGKPQCAWNDRVKTVVDFTLGDMMKVFPWGALKELIIGGIGAAVGPLIAIAVPRPVTAIARAPEKD